MVFNLYCLIAAGAAWKIVYVFQENLEGIMTHMNAAELLLKVFMLQ